MNIRSFVFASTTAVFALLGCSTPKPVTPVTAAPPVLVPELQYDLPLEQPDPGRVPFGKVCKLSTSCIAMDPRPFEPCLLSTKDCRDKAAEPLQVEQPKSVEPPPVIKTTY